MATVATPLRIGLADHGRALTLEEFLEAEETEGYRYELARGVLEVSEVPDDPHGDVVANLYDAISRYRREHPGVIRRYGGGNEFRFWLPGMISGAIPTWASSCTEPPRIGAAGGSPRWLPRSSRAGASSAIT